ncbi:MAG: hypothetical protein ACRD8Z_00765 [Nitrososphaeraceae archaeon]
MEKWYNQVSFSHFIYVINDSWKVYEIEAAFYLILSSFQKTVVTLENSWGQKKVDES